jgi:hypothetical protein
MNRELAQAIRDLAQTGRLSPDSEEALSTILDPEPDEEKDDNDKSSTDEKSSGTRSSSAHKSTTTGGKSR